VLEKDHNILSQRFLPPDRLENPCNGVTDYAEKVQGLYYTVRCLVPTTEKTCCMHAFKPSQLAVFLEHLDEEHGGGGVLRPNTQTEFLASHGLLGKTQVLDSVAFWVEIANRGLVTTAINGQEVPLGDNEWNYMMKRAGKTVSAGKMPVVEAEQDREQTVEDVDEVDFLNYHLN
jgi:hypothetical protein